MYQLMMFVTFTCAWWNGSNCHEHEPTNVVIARYSTMSACQEGRETVRLRYYTFCAGTK